MWIYIYIQVYVCVCMYMCYMCMYACKYVYIYIYMALGSSPELFVIIEGVQLNLYQPLCMLSRTF